MFCPFSFGADLRAVLGLLPHRAEPFLRLLPDRGAGGRGQRVRHGGTRLERRGVVGLHLGVLLLHTLRLRAGAFPGDEVAAESALFDHLVVVPFHAVLVPPHAVRLLQASLDDHLAAVHGHARLERVELASRPIPRGLAVVGSFQQRESLFNDCPIGKGGEMIQSMSVRPALYSHRVP